MSESEESYEASQQQSYVEEAPSFDKNRASYSSKQINSKQQTSSSDEDINCNEFFYRLQARIESIQIKLLNISNTMGLMQRYNEVKDVQFEKELETAKYEGQAEAFQKWSFLVEKKIMELDTFANNFSDRLSRGAPTTENNQVGSFKFQSSSFRPSYCPCVESLPKFQKNVSEQFRILHMRLKSLQCLCSNNYSASTDNYIEMAMGAAAKMTLKESRDIQGEKVIMKTVKSPNKKQKIRGFQSQRQIADLRLKSKGSQKSSRFFKKLRN